MNKLTDRKKNTFILPNSPDIPAFRTALSPGFSQISDEGLVNMLDIIADFQILVQRFKLIPTIPDIRLISQEKLGRALMLETDEYKPLKRLWDTLDKKGWITRVSEIKVSTFKVFPPSSEQPQLDLSKLTATDLKLIFRFIDQLEHWSSVKKDEAKKYLQDCLNYKP